MVSYFEGATHNIHSRASTQAHAHTKVMTELHEVPPHKPTSSTFHSAPSTHTGITIFTNIPSSLRSLVFISSHHHNLPSPSPFTSIPMYSNIPSITDLRVSSPFPFISLLPYTDGHHLTCPLTYVHLYTTHSLSINLPSSLHTLSINSLTYGTC